MDKEVFPWEKEFPIDISLEREIDKKDNLVEFPNEPAYVPEGNQARVHSNSIYPESYKNLLFMTKYEKAFHLALEDYVLLSKNEAIGIEPQCPTLFYKDGKIRRVQPDTKLLYKNYLAVIELDGLSHAYDSPEYEQSRLDVFSLNGCFVIRLDAPDPSYDSAQLSAWAKEAVAKTFAYLDKLIDGRK